ncbi:MAG: hypothetical protein ABH848_02645, partial [Candidatus Omnitrophota bacterium]
YIHADRVTASSECNPKHTSEAEKYMKINNEKGLVLVVIYMVIALLMVLTIGFASRSFADQRSATFQRDHTQAFWLAEAGLSHAIDTLPDDVTQKNITNVAGIQLGNYITKTEFISGATNRYRVSARGDVGNTMRQLVSLVVYPSGHYDPTNIGAALTSDGGIKKQPNADIIGGILEFADFEFEDIFGIPQDVLRYHASHIYYDPGNALEKNEIPVEGITIIDMPPEENQRELQITDGHFDGSGILIVNGDLRLTGGTFHGIIWVNGEFNMGAGNASVYGAVFVKSGATTEVNAAVAGTILIEKDDDVLNDIDEWIPDDYATVLSWREVTDQVIDFN